MVDCKIYIMNIVISITDGKILITNNNNELIILKYILVAIDISN